MSYRYETNPDTKVTDLIFEGWEDGIADSAFEGHQFMQHVDIFTYPKMVLATYKAVKKVGTGDLVRWLVRDPTTRDIFGVDYSGNFYQSTTSGASWTTPAAPAANSGQGLSIWRNYLILVASTNVYTYGPLTGSPSWSSALAVSGSVGIIGGLWHPSTTFQSYDRAVYFGNSNYVGGLVENLESSFDPGNTGTYTLSGDLLQLPEYNVVKCIGQLGQNLLIGTFQGSNITDNAYGQIFPWPAPQPGYNAPTSLSANGVNMIKSQGNIAYIYAGIGADFFYTNGSFTQPYKRLYNITFTSPAENLNPQPGAIDILNTLDLLVGMSYLGGVPGPLGVYAIRNGVHILKNLPSTGNDTGITIGAVLATGRDSYIFSWQDDNTSPSQFGIDAVGMDGRYTDYSSIIWTDAANVGIKNVKNTFQQLEVRLAKVLETGDGVQVSYRLDLNDGWTLIKDFDDTSDLANNLSATCNANINQAQTIQLQVQVKNNAVLQQIRLR